MQETSVQSLGWEDSLEKGIATHSSTLAWRIPWTEEPDGLQSMRSQSRIRLSDFHSHRELYNLYILWFTHLQFNSLKVCQNQEDISQLQNQCSNKEIQFEEERTGENSGGNFVINTTKKSLKENVSMAGHMGYEASACTVEGRGSKHRGKRRWSPWNRGRRGRWT